MPNQHDRNICNQVLFQFNNERLGRVDFQFPPKILSDNRSATWSEGEIMGREPIAILKKSGPRVFSMTWTYVVESITDRTESIWTIEKIRTEVNKVRGYFPDIDRLGGLRKNLIIYFQHEMITGYGAWTCRIKDVSVKHSENLIGNPGYVYPLRTDITVDLRLWTNGIERGGDPLKAVQIIEDLKNEPAFGDLWY